MSKQEEILGRIKNCIITFDVNGVKDACKAALQSGILPYEIVTEGMAKGLGVVGEKYEAGEYFLTELIMAGEMMRQGMEVLRPYMEVRREVGPEVIGKVVIGTVEGDLHDIGKNIVASLLTGAGFEVIDLGFDVPAQKFVEEVRKSEADILGMSALLTTTMPKMGEVIRKLQEEGLRDKVKVIIGGTPIDDEFGKEIGADAATNDGVRGITICKKWMMTK